MFAARDLPSVLLPTPLAVALLLATACGGSDVGDHAFGGGSASGPSTTTSTGTGATTTSTSTQGTGGEAPTGPGGGAADGGGGTTSSSDGGGSSSAEGGGGSSSAEGGGGAGPATCDGGCDPAADPAADCDDDADPNGTDCQPCDPAAFTGQTTYFDVPYTTFPGGEPSFDYDCSGELTSEYPYVPGGCDAFNASSCPDGDSIYVGDQAPECGAMRTVEDCALAGIVIGSCETDGPSSIVAVRCR